MRSDEVHAVEGLNERLQALRDKSVRLKTLRDTLQKDLSSKEQEVQELSDQVDKLTKVGELFRALLDLLVLKQVRSVEAIVTEGFKTIFHDLDLSFESEVGPKYNKISVDFFIRQGSKDSPLSHRGHPLGAFGGGPSSVASFILRVLTVMRLGRWPLFILDEAMGAVSDEYTENTAMFLRGLAKRMGADILLVTHKPSFCEPANLAYKSLEVVEDDGTRHLTLRALKRGSREDPE